MSYTNFKPEFWSNHIQHELAKFTVFENDCDYKFEGEIQHGKSLHIIGVTAPTIGDYTGASIGSPEDIEGEKQTLLVDKAKYFNIGIDDVDRAQSMKGTFEAYMDETTRAMAEVRDSYIANLATGHAYTSASLAITDKDTAKDAVDGALLNLMNNGVKAGRDKVTIYLTPAFYFAFKDYIVETKTKNDSALASGELGRYMGANIKITNNAAKDGSDDLIIVKTSKAIAFASQINNVEAYRPQDLFKDAVKGLNTFGGKVVRPKEMYVIKAHYTA